MNDLGRYRKLFVRLWRHPGFTALTDAEKVLAVYLLTGPQTNRIGLFVLSIAQAAEDLGTVPETLSKRLVRVTETFEWVFDKRSRVFFVPSWWRWNEPANANVVKGNLKDLNEIPPCGLLDAFAANTETVPHTLRGEFIEGLRQRLANGMPTQKQYQEAVSGDQEQKTPRAGFEREGGSSSVRANGEPPARLIKLARETLRLVSPTRPLEELVDAFINQHGSNLASRVQIEEALNATRLLQ
jgi:hypothetical protein